MVFEDQSLSGFLHATEQAGQILREEGLKSRRSLSFEEGLAMQAASDVLAVRDSFYGLEIITALGRPAGSIYPLLNRFEYSYKLTVSTFEDKLEAQNAGRPPRREYSPTEFGTKILNLFSSTY